MIFAVASISIIFLFFHWLISSICRRLFYFDFFRFQRQLRGFSSFIFISLIDFFFLRRRFFIISIFFFADAALIFISAFSISFSRFRFLDFDAWLFSFASRWFFDISYLSMDYFFIFDFSSISSFISIYFLHWLMVSSSYYCHLRLFSLSAVDAFSLIDYYFRFLLFSMPFRCAISALWCFRFLSFSLFRIDLRFIFCVLIFDYESYFLDSLFISLLRRHYFLPFDADVFFIWCSSSFLRHWLISFFSVLMNITPHSLLPLMISISIDCIISLFRFRWCIHVELMRYADIDAFIIISIISPFHWGTFSLERLYFIAALSRHFRVLFATIFTISLSFIISSIIFDFRLSLEIFFLSLRFLRLFRLSLFLMPWWFLLDRALSCVFAASFRLFFDFSSIFCHCISHFARWFIFSVNFHYFATLRWIISFQP